MTTQAMVAKGKLTGWKDFEKQVLAAEKMEVVFGLFHAAEEAGANWIPNRDGELEARSLDFLASLRDLCNDRDFYKAWLRLAASCLNRWLFIAPTLRAPVKEDTWAKILTLLYPNELESLHDPYRNKLKTFCENAIKEFPKTDWPRELRRHIYKIVLDYAWYDLFLLPESEDIGLEVLGQSVFGSQALLTIGGLQSALIFNTRIPWDQKRAEYLCILLVRFGHVMLASQGEST